MFSATVFIITMAGGAAALNDTRGPYLTKGECETRVEQMKTDAADAFKVYGVMQLQGRCKETDETAI